MQNTIVARLRRGHYEVEGELASILLYIFEGGRVENTAKFLLSLRSANVQPSEIEKYKSVKKLSVNSN